MYEERFFHHFLSQPQVFVTIIVCSGDLGVAGTWAAVRGRLTEARGGCKSLVIQAVCILPLAFRRHSLGEACMTGTPQRRGLHAAAAHFHTWCVGQALLRPNEGAPCSRSWMVLCGEGRGGGGACRALWHSWHWLSCAGTMRLFVCDEWSV